MKIMRYPRHCLQTKHGTMSECLPVHKHVAKFKFDDFVTCEILLCTIHIVLWCVVTRGVQEIPLWRWRQEVYPKHCYVFSKLHNKHFIKLTAAIKSDFRKVLDLRNSFPSAHSQKPDSCPISYCSTSYILYVFRAYDDVRLTGRY